MSDSGEQCKIDARSQIFQKLCGFIHAIPGGDTDCELSEQTALADLAMDSLRLVEIIFELERHFDCAADEGLIAEARTLGDIVALFADHAGRGEASA